MVHRQLLQH